MRTTVILKDELLALASEATGITEKTALIHRGLEELVKKVARERLIKMGGSDPHARIAPRRAKSRNTK